MAMKRCSFCRWWFEPKSGNQKYCDSECRQEGLRESWKRSKAKKYAREKQKKSILRIDPAKLPKPPRAPTREWNGKDMNDIEIEKLWKAEQRRRSWEMRRKQEAESGT